MTTAERWLKLSAPRAVLISSAVGIVSSSGGAAAGGSAEALPALVVGDLEQPVAGLLRLLAADERPVGAQEGRLGRVLGVGLIPHDGQDVAIDLVHVASVEALERTVSRRRRSE
jgi:hypothetical protein